MVGTVALYSVLIWFYWESDRERHDSLHTQTHTTRTHTHAHAHACMHKKHRYDKSVYSNYVCCSVCVVHCYTHTHTHSQCKWIRTKISPRTRQTSALPHSIKIARVRKKEASECRILHFICCVLMLFLWEAALPAITRHTCTNTNANKNIRARIHSHAPSMSCWVHSLLSEWIILCSTIYLRCRIWNVRLSTWIYEFCWCCYFQKCQWWLLLRFIWILSRIQSNFCWAESNPINFHDYFVRK